MGWPLREAVARNSHGNYWCRCFERERQFASQNLARKWYKNRIRNTWVSHLYGEHAEGPHIRFPCSLRALFLDQLRCLPSDVSSALDRKRCLLILHILARCKPKVTDDGNFLVGNQDIVLFSLSVFALKISRFSSYSFYIIVNDSFSVEKLQTSQGAMNLKGFFLSAYASGLSENNSPVGGATRQDWF